MAALAYGTATIAPVAKIVGPGNAYVAAAKRLVFGKVGIDMIAGPSEVLIIADGTGNPGWIAADLLAQAEHDADAQSILITDERAARRRGRARGASRSSRRCRARRSRGASWRDFGAIILVADARRGACRWSMRIAAEHLEIVTADPEALAAQDPQCRRDLPRAAHAGGDRRLCRRLQPRAADRALGAVLLGARRARFHEAHLDPEMRPGAAARARAGGDRAGRGRRPRRARALGRDRASTRHDQAATRPGSRNNRIVAVTLDEESIGRSGPDIEHERAIAIYDLIEENLFAPVARPAGRSRCISASPATG